MSKLNNIIEKYILPKKDNESNELPKEEEYLDKNYVQVEGTISNISNSFVKRDGIKAKFLDIEHKYEYNDSIRKGSMAVMLEGNVLDAFQDKVSVGDKVFITGNIRNYMGKNKQEKYIINCYDLEVLEKNKEVERQ